jgi:hypothetical protein
MQASNSSRNCTVCWYRLKPTFINAHNCLISPSRIAGLLSSEPSCPKLPRPPRLFYMLIERILSRTRHCERIRPHFSLKLIHTWEREMGSKGFRSSNLNKIPCACGHAPSFGDLKIHTIANFPTSIIYRFLAGNGQAVTAVMFSCTYVPFGSCACGRHASIII